MPSLTETYCLFCGKKVPFYRLAAQHQFCSSAHEAAFAQEQTRLAVETLHRTHDALKAYIPQVAAEDILGPDPAQPPQPVLEQPAAQLVDLAAAVQRAALPAAPPRAVEAVHFGESLQLLQSPDRGFWARLRRWLGLS